MFFFFFFFFGGGGGVLIPRGVQNFEFQYCWVFRKMNIFWGMKILWIIFGVITKLDYI